MQATTMTAPTFDLGAVVARRRRGRASKAGPCLPRVAALRSFNLQLNLGATAPGDPSLPGDRSLSQPDSRSANLLSISSVSIPACEAPGSRRIPRRRTDRQGTGRSTHARSFALRALLPATPATPASRAATGASYRSPLTSAGSHASRWRSWLAATPLEGVPERGQLYRDSGGSVTLAPASNLRTSARPGAVTRMQWVTPLPMALPAEEAAMPGATAGAGLPHGSCGSATAAAAGTPLEGVPERPDGPQTCARVRMAALRAAALGGYKDRTPPFKSLPAARLLDPGCAAELASSPDAANAAEPSRRAVEVQTSASLGACARTAMASIHAMPIPPLLPVPTSPDDGDCDNGDHASDGLDDGGHGVSSPDSTPAAMRALRSAPSTAAASPAHSPLLHEAAADDGDDGATEGSPAVPVSEAVRHPGVLATHASPHDQPPPGTACKPSGPGVYGEDGNEELEMGGHIEAENGGWPEGLVPAMPKPGAEAVAGGDATETAAKNGAVAQAAAAGRKAGRPAKKPRVAARAEAEPVPSSSAAAAAAAVSAHRRRKSLAGAGMLVDEDGCRRSSRARIRPLEYWRNEHKLWGREHRTLPTVVGIETRTPNPQWPLMSTGHVVKKSKARTKGAQGGGGHASSRGRAVHNGSSSDDD